MTQAYGLTRNQRDALLVIQELTELDGVAPTYREINHELGFSSLSEIQRTITALCERGHLTRMDRRTRSLVVLSPIPMPDDVEFVIRPAEHRYPGEKEPAA